jgi:hypothetical protein
MLTEFDRFVVIVVGNGKCNANLLIGGKISIGAQVTESHKI